MKKTALILLSLIITANCFSQGFINLKKSWVEEQLTDYNKTYKLRTTTKETDSSIIYQIRDSSVQPLDLEVLFDSHGKCNEEVHSSSCDTCIKKYIAQILADRNAGWIKINDNEYLSRYSLKLILELDPANPLVYYIKRDDYSRKAYKALIKKKH